MTFLQKKLDELFTKKAPARIPANGKNLIVEWLPWVYLVLGIFGMLSAWWIWNAASQVSRIFNPDTNATFYSEIYGAQQNVSLGIIFWISLVSLVVASVLMLASFPGLRERSITRGWNLAYYAVLLNFVYGLLYLFSGIDGAFGQFIWTLITTTLGLYVLFQVRTLYKDETNSK